MLRRQLARTAELLAPRLLYRYRLGKYSSYEPEQTLVPYFCDKEHLAIDVGANIGIYSGQMVKYAKACHAFEANPYLARQLQRAAVPGLTVTNAAVSDRAGDLTLYIPRSTPGLATVERAHPDAFGGEESAGLVAAVKVRAVRLDDLEFDGISFIKIDVEGHEEAVLRGSRETIAKHRPFMLIESENRHNPGAVGRVCKLLSDHEYLCFVLKKNRLKPLSEFDEKRDQDPAALGNESGAIYINNFVFIPSERLGAFAERSRLLGA
jgi:FkbM family methyltransferase